MLVVTVVAVAYGTAGPQFAVAEFAPAARSDLAAPSTTQPGGDPQRGAGSGKRSTTTAPSTTQAGPSSDAGQQAAPTSRVARSRPCYGDPPRQIEDPMSPPCAATIYSGDNGGVTARGVTLTEIRVEVPLWSATTAMTAALDALFEYFNQRFEFYGRRLVPVYRVHGAQTALDARAMVADIVNDGIFAVLTGPQEIYSVHAALPLELARQGIVAITRGAGVSWSDRILYDAWHPYVWSVYPSAEDLQANLGAFACNVLAGGPARFAGDPNLRGATRKFGVLNTGWVQVQSTNVLTQALTDCTGVAPIEVQATGSGQVRTALERLRAAGATTVVCVCEDDLPVSSLQTANTAAFYPEWLLGPVTWWPCEHECWVQDLRAGSKLPPPLLLDAGPRLLPVQARLWYGALQPVLGLPGADAATVLGLSDLVYTSLLMLASGIQGAGPDLTPDTFGQALMTMPFANPGAGRAPYWQPSAGFGPGDHSFYDDYNVGWWFDEADGLEQPQGARAKGSWCYLDQGARFRVGSYPAGPAVEARLFNRDEPCR